MNRVGEPQFVNFEQLIAEAGYTATKARHMLLIVQCVLETLKHAEECLERDWHSFCEKVGSSRLRTDRVKAVKNTDNHSVFPYENAITYELGDYIDLYLKGLPSTHTYRGAIKFDFERPMRSKKLAGSKRKRQDLRYEAYVVDGPELVIEAKPLLYDVDIKKRYLGDEGLGRFTREEEPFTSEALAALMGYVKKDPAACWSKQIRQACASSDGHQITLDVQLDRWNGCSYASCHARPNKLPSVWVLHFLLQYPEPL